VALYHLTARTGTRAAGQSALAKAQYLQREGRYERVPDRVEYATSRNLPSFAAGDAVAYWEAADVYERANARLFKEVEFALPIELEPSERQQLAESFAEQLLAGEKLPYTLAIHEGRGHNPHCHVLISERVNDGVEREPSQWFRRWNAREPDLGGARKTEALKPREWLERVREQWADFANQALERGGHLERVDHRSLEAQGIDRVPQIHLGPNLVRMEERGLQTERADLMLHIEERNRQLDRARSELIQIERMKEAERGRDGTNPESPAGGSPEPRPRNLAAEREHPGAPGIAGHSELDAGPRPHARHDPAGGPGRPADAEGGDAPSSSGADGSPKLAGSHTAGTTAGAPDHPPTDRRPRPDGGRSRGHDRAEDLGREPATPAARDLGRGGLASDAPSRTQAAREAPGLEPADRTRRAVELQLRGMGCDFFDLGILDRESGRMMHRTWSRDRVLDSLPALRAFNARGSDIYIRPAAEIERPGLVLVDDLKPAALDRMERDGRSPAVVVETSPGNFQAWVRVPARALERERGEIARRLAREYEADRGSASPLHFGRLAGFTNRKEIHRGRDGLQPFALLRSAPGREAPDGELLLRQAGRALEERARGLGKARESEVSLPTRAPTPEAEREATEIYRRRFKELHRTMDDRSHCDFSVARHLVERGYEPRTIERAMTAASPDLEERKPGHVRDYVHRTVESAVEIYSQERARTERTLAGSRLPDTPETEREATDLCRRELMKSTRQIADPNERDLAAAFRLAEVGYGARTIERALETASPDLESRTQGQVDRYVQVAAHISLREHARQLGRELARDRGMER
jgi:hypothetical protein